MMLLSGHIMECLAQVKFDLTFGLLHTAEKSAEIREDSSMTPNKLQTITPTISVHLQKISR